LGLYVVFVRQLLPFTGRPGMSVSGRFGPTMNAWIIGNRNSIKA
jgi:hypothetical protein